MAPFTELLDRVYGSEAPPAPAPVDAAVMRVVRAQYAPQSRGRVTPFPARDPRALPAPVRWWVALLVATLSFGGGLAAAQTLPRHATPSVAGGAPPAFVQEYAQAEKLRASGRCDHAIPLYRRAISAYAT